MKTNRIVALLAVLCLITTCFVGTTLAKYTVTSEAGDSARVAKFGVEIVSADKMFNDSYKDAETTYTANEEGDAITVQADTEGTNVVAPGTKGALVGFAVTGTPEVDVTVTYVADLALTGWEVDGAYYCPIVITVNDEDIDGGSFASAAEFEAAVEEAIEEKAATYDTNTDLSAVNDDVKVSWAWAFEGDDDGAAAGQTDALDTALGDNAAGIDGGTAANIALTIETTITQVD